MFPYAKKPSPPTPTATTELSDLELGSKVEWEGKEIARAAEK